MSSTNSMAHPCDLRRCGVRIGYPAIMTVASVAMPTAPEMHPRKPQGYGNRRRGLRLPRLLERVLPTYGGGRPKDHRTVAFNGIMQAIHCAHLVRGAATV